MNERVDCFIGFSRFGIRLRSCLCSLLLCAAALAQDAPHGQFRVLKVDAGKVIGEIHSFQAVNGPPSPLMAGLPNLVQQYKELRIDLVRTHDFMGPTDKVLASIRASGAAIYYRVGRSWGANAEPPPDFDKFASVVKHIAMHYNQGWANGFHYDIRYWEFWNEPGFIFWSGTPEQFYSLYEKTARTLKSVDPALKVGGDAKAIASDDGPYRDGLIDYCAAHHVPLDFYSWHTYANSSADPYDAVRLAQQIRGLLDTHGFPKAESILSEWNLTADFTEHEKARLQGMETAAYIGAVLTYLQDAPIDHAHFYRADAAWMGLFDLDGHYFKTAHAFEAMGKMLDTPQRLSVEGADTFGFAALAGRSADGKTIQILISNYAIPEGFKPYDMKMPPEVLKEAPVPDFSKTSGGIF